MANITTLPNYLGLFSSTGDVDVTKTHDLMELSRTQLAEALGFTGEQLRPERLSDRAKGKLTELAGALEMVAAAFRGDINKTKFWIKTPNPNFGGATPRQLIVRGRYKKVIQFIIDSQKLSA
jgi:hypothetical protein